MHDLLMILEPYIYCNASYLGNSFKKFTAAMSVFGLSMYYAFRNTSCFMWIIEMGMKSEQNFDIASLKSATFEVKNSEISRVSCCPSVFEPTSPAVIAH